MPSPNVQRQIIVVKDEASFKAALAKARAGATIRLTDGAYPQLTVRKRSVSRQIRIVGSRNVKLAGIVFARSRNIVLEGVTITPPATQPAAVEITESSRKIVIERVLVDGRDENVGAFIQPRTGTFDVTIRNSELTNCGRGRGCVRLGARSLRVLGNRFYDCRSCDFIKGGGSGALVRGNTFTLAHNVGCTGGAASCPHNNHIHIMAGGPWTIVGNRFGDVQGGPGQIFASPTRNTEGRPIHDLLIASNVFTGHAGVAVRIGVGQKSPAGPPKNVRIVNNTILTAQLSAVFLNEPWARVPAAERPLVANNILNSVKDFNCGRGRFVANLVLEAPSCGNDPTGDAKLDLATAAPTAASSLVVDKADPRYAPKTDFYGRRRNGPPDIGAIEFRTR